MMTQSAIIIATADTALRAEILSQLHRNRRRAEEALSGAEALMKLESGGFESLLLDRHLPDLEANDIQRLVDQRFPSLDIVLLEDGRSLSMTREPRNALTRELIWLLREPEAARQAVDCGAGVPAAKELLPGVLGESAGIAHVARMVKLVARRTTPVLLTGETGTGKELVARSIHALSPRASRPFVVVNCAAIPETLLESELFGYNRGAFTGAMQNKLGRIHAAESGTLLLDEIGELPLSMQAKLLRFLQEGELQKLGSVESERVDVRIIAATNVDLPAQCAAKTFRPDLYYRISVFPIEIPPLRSRSQDAVLIAGFFLKRLCEQTQQKKSLDPRVVAAFSRYGWPGNVRELQHMLERAFILSEDESVLTQEHFPALFLPLS